MNHSKVRCTGCIHMTSYGEELHECAAHDTIVIGENYHTCLHFNPKVYPIHNEAYVIEQAWLKIGALDWPEMKATRINPNNDHSLQCASKVCTLRIDENHATLLLADRRFPHITPEFIRTDDFPTHLPNWIAVNFSHFVTQEGFMYLPATPSIIATPAVEAQRAPFHDILTHLAARAVLEYPDNSKEISELGYFLEHHNPVAPTAIQTQLTGDSSTMKTTTITRITVETTTTENNTREFNDIATAIQFMLNNTDAAYTPPVDVTKPTMSALDVLLGHLDSKFEYRTLTSTINALESANLHQTEFCMDDIEDLLENNGFDMVTKTRRSDGEILLKAVRQENDRVELDGLDVPTDSVNFYSMSASGKVFHMLNHSNYPLRSINSIQEKTGLYGQDLMHVLSNFDVVYRSRRSDRAQLVGLTSRNS